MIAAYPRPQLQRDGYLCLNGEWDFAVTRSDAVPASFPETIQVPYPPESNLSGIGRRIGKQDRMFYRRFFRLPDGFQKDRVLLHFGAVDQVCEVYLNGSSLGRHEGGYLPFIFDITGVLREENELIVRAVDSIDHTYPWGKQNVKNGGMWYTPFSGIWQTVWIESVPDRFIRSLKMTPSLSSLTLTITDSYGTPDETALTLHLPDGDRIWEFNSDSVEIPVPNPNPWTPEHPYLYRFTLNRGKDTVHSYFALRTLSIGDVNGIPRILLNGKPYFFHGLLDQGYWLDGICTPPDDRAYEEDILFAKSLGFNMLRKHIRIEPLPFYEACDRLGIIVFQDFVNNGKYRYVRDTVLPTIGFVKKNDRRRHFTDEERNMFKQTMLQTVRHLYNSPCIAYWTIYNEGWGQSNADAMYALLKAADGTRIIDATSGWFWQKESDVDSYHLYFRPLKEFGGSRPLVLSEFGGYSYGTEGKQYGYKFLETREAYRDAIKKVYTDEIIPAAKKGLCAAVYTQINDIEEEQNGLISYDRGTTKVFAEDMLPIAKELQSAVK